MKTHLFFPILFFAFYLGMSNAQASPLDSIGIEKKEGKLFVLHKVEAKETLYSISKRYGVSVEEIKANNTVEAEGIKIGQVLRVPAKVKTPVEVKAVTPGNPTEVYKVQKKETLYGIAKKFKVSVDQIKAVNPGMSDALKEGQEIRIPKTSSTPIQTPAKATAKPKKGEVPAGNRTHKVQAKETLYGISQKYKVSVEDIKKANPKLEEGLKVGDEIIIPGTETIAALNKPKTVTTEVKPVSPGIKEPETPLYPKVENTYNPKAEYKKVSENGFVELMQTKTDLPKFHALHRTAPIGTVMEVTNTATGQKIFVRVIGKLTDPVNSDTVLKISPKAFERAGGKDQKLAVVVDYIL